VVAVGDGAHVLDSLPCMVMREWARRGAVLLAAVVVAGTGLLAGTAAPAAAKAPGQWWAGELDLDAVHAITRGEGATIGLLDTGVDVTHPDLADADVTGKDTWSKNKDGLTDTQGHGTAMASLLVGQGLDGGILGVAPDARLVVYAPQMGELSGAFYDADYTAGIAWLVEQRVDVIVIASGSPSPPRLSEARALRTAERLGIPVVAAAGNTETAISDEVEYPGAVPGVLAVSGTGLGGAFSKASLSGPEVAVAAPGEDIGGAIPPGMPGFGGDLYFTGSGTSDSTAITGGVIALLAARFPDASREQLLYRLTSTATDRGPAGRDEKYGYGVIDPLAALDEGVDMTGAAPAPAARGELPAWSAVAMAYVVPPRPVWTRLDIWTVCGLAVVAGMVLVMAVKFGPRRWRSAALVLVVLVVGMAATGTAVTIARVTDPPDVALAWPGIGDAPPAGEYPHAEVCLHASEETGLYFEAFMEPRYPDRGDDSCIIRFPSSGLADDPGFSARDLAVRISWQPLGEGVAAPLLGCPEGAAVWTATSGTPVCTQDTADPDFDTYSTSRFITRQTWVSVEVLEELRVDRPGFVHQLLELIVPVIVTGTRTAA